MTALRASFIFLAFVVTALAQLPLRIVWAASGAPADMRFEAIHGTLWTGKLSGVNWRGFNLGDLATTSSLIDRLGDVMLRVRSEAGPLRSAAMQLSSGGAKIEDIGLVVDLADVLPGAPAGARLRLSDGAAVLDGAACRSASGSVLTDAVPGQGIPAFAGALECLSGRFAARLSSADGVHRLAVALDRNGGAPGLKVIEASAATTLWLSALGIGISAGEVVQ
jgi:hypothetical protein